VNFTSLIQVGRASLNIVRDVDNQESFDTYECLIRQP